jgi:hypothetical protein
MRRHCARKSTRVLASSSGARGSVGFLVGAIGVQASPVVLAYAVDGRRVAVGGPDFGVVFLSHHGRRRGGRYQRSGSALVKVSAGAVPDSKRDLAGIDPVQSKSVEHGRPPSFLFLGRVADYPSGRG